MSTVHILPADRVPLTALVSALNRAYSDYYYPIYVTPSSLHAMLARDDIAPANCAVALEDDEVVGMGLLGMRGTAGWIGGMGVVPHRRQRGIGGRLLRTLIANARALSIQTLRLEVIEENQHAHALYQQHGFRDVRFLHMLERPLLPPPPPPERCGIIITPETPQTLLSYYADFHDVRNCWQRDLPSLKRLAFHSQGRALYDIEKASDGEKPDTPIGYVLGQFTPHSVLTFDMAVPPTNRRRHTHAQVLLMHIHHHYPHALGHAYNVAEDDHAIHAYRDLGYQTHLRQIEMELALS